MLEALNYVAGMVQLEVVLGNTKQIIEANSAGCKVHGSHVGSPIISLVTEGCCFNTKDLLLAIELFY